jgi:hypothetical protein
MAMNGKIKGCKSLKQDDDIIFFFRLHHDRIAYKTLNASTKIINNKVKIVKQPLCC